MNRDRAASILETQADARNVPVSRTAFRIPVVAARARVDYGALAATTRTVFVPFDEALTTVLALVDALPIPDD